METMVFHTPQDILIKDIALCVQDAGYITDVDNPERLKETLHIHHKIQFGGSLTTDYTRWYQLKQGITELEPELRDEALQISPNSKNCFIIYFRINDLYSLSILLSKILRCFGGYIHSNGSVFDIKNIDTFPQYHSLD